MNHPTLFRHVPLTVAVHLAATTVALGQCEVARLGGRETGANDSFGDAVSASGDLIAVGSPEESPMGRYRAGAVHIFRRRGAEWIREARLAPDDLEPRAKFGIDLDLRGDTLAVKGLAPAIFLFRRAGAGDWKLEATLFPPSYSGSLALGDGALVVGTPFDRLAGDDGPNAGAAYVYRRTDGEWVREARLVVAPDAERADHFGHAVAIAGDDRVVVGAPENDVGGHAAGVAHVFSRASGEWVHEATLRGSDTSGQDRFGGAVSIDGTHIAVGASGAGRGQSIGPGATYLFERRGDWVEAAVVSDPEPESGPKFSRNFGGSVELAGSALVVRGGLLRGVIYVFRREGSEWMLEQRVSDDDVGGIDVIGPATFSDRTLVIGGRIENDGSRRIRGIALVHRYEGGLWSEEARLTLGTEEDDDRFGDAVVAQGDLAVVGAPGDDDREAGVVDAGSVNVFRRAAARDWSRVQALRASDAREGDAFGSAVAASDELIVVGASVADGNEPDTGAAYVFRREDDPATDDGSWAEEARLSAADGTAGDLFGASVAVGGELVAVGAPRSEANGRRTGGFHVFRREVGIWEEERVVLATALEEGAQFGRALSLGADVLVVGSPGDEFGDDPGAAYVFLREGNAWVETERLTASDGGPGQGFGASVSVHGARVLVGAPGASGTVAGTGAAYVFRHDGGGGWVEEAKLLDPAGSGGDRLGAAVSLRRDDAVLGAPGTDEQKGAILVFGRDGENWLSQGMHVARSGLSGDGYGAAVFLDETGGALVGAPRAIDAGVPAGSAFHLQVLVEPDCNDNGVADICDVVSGASRDCDSNGVPDECELAGSVDTNGNDVPDICEVPFRRGDADASGVVDISDAIFDLSMQFVGGTGNIACRKAFDTDDNGVNDISDPIYTLAFLFIGNVPPPPAPGYRDCGLDPTRDGMECESYPAACD